MKSIKIVQSGDFHLDSPLTLHQINFRDQRREELLDAVSVLVQEANKEKADLLLLTGDLFDSSRVSKRTLLFLQKEFNKFQGWIFISPGNHDPYTIDSPYSTFEFGEKVHIFREYEEVYLEALDCVVCGAGFETSYVRENLLKPPTNERQAQIKILVMHGDVTEGNSTYNPISKESIAESGYTYIALGHKHTYSGIQKEGGTSYAYAGIPEGRGFDELGEKGIIVGTVYETGVALTFRKTSKRVYRQLGIEITGILTTEDVLRKVQSSLCDDASIYRIILQGECSPYFQIDYSIIISRLSVLLPDFDLKDETRLEQNRESFSHHSLRGVFMEVLNERREQEMNEEIWDEVEKVGLRLLQAGGPL